ncbi:MAG: DoxX family protein [Pseudomonadales bacterium]|jgi:putative oxidoreductase|nr:DoxX family protein [Pseudomonadales bacterium]
MGSQIELAQKVLLLAGRALLGLYFIVPGIMKVLGFEGTAEAMANQGVPMVTVLLVLTIIIQIGGGFCLAAGIRTQVVAFVLAGLTLVISLFMHSFWAMEEGIQQAHEMQNFIKNMAIMAGLMCLAGTAKSS